MINQAMLIYRLKVERDLKETGFAPMKYALHFIGQAFHGADKKTSKKGGVAKVVNELLRIEKHLVPIR